MQRARKSARQKARRLQYNGQEEYDGKHGDNNAGDIALGAIVENTRLAIEFLKGGFLFDGTGTRPAARRSIFKRDAVFASFFPFFLWAKRLWRYSIVRCSSLNRGQWRAPSNTAFTNAINSAAGRIA